MADWHVLSITYTSAIAVRYEVKTPIFSNNHAAEFAYSFLYWSHRMIWNSIPRIYHQQMYDTKRTTEESEAHHHNGIEDQQPYMNRNLLAMKYQLQ